MVVRDAQLDPALPPDEVAARLDDTARSLLAANATLYGGRWDDFAEDLRRRQAGKPYLFAHATPVAEALGWIHRFRAYETARGEPLAHGTWRSDR